MESDSIESKLNSSNLKGMMKMTIDVKDVKRFWLVPVGTGSDLELVLEIGEGKTYQYQKTYMSERFYNYLSSSADFVKFAGKSIKKSLVNKIELKGDLANPKIWIYLIGYKNPIQIGPELRISRDDIGMLDTFEHLKKIFNH